MILSWELTTMSIAEATLDEPRQETLAQDLVERAKGIAPRISELAVQAERDRRIPDEVVKLIADAGLYEVLVPKRFGGHELGVKEMVDVLKVISPLCASTGWTTGFYMVHNWMWCHLPDEAQQEIFAEGPSALGPVMIAPTVKAVPVKGGYRINGRARWGTGQSHASWCGVSGIIESADDQAVSEDGKPLPPQVRVFVMPWADASPQDTWYTSGMAATASHDVVFDDVFIPSHRVMDLGPARSGESPAASQYPTPAFSTAFTPLLAIAAVAPLVGAARGAALHAVERAKEFVSTYSGKSGVDSPALQMRLARADLMTRSAMTLLDKLADDIVADSHNTPIDIESRALQRVQASHIASLCRDAVTLLVQGSGASAHMADSPIQRCFRDINMASAHVVFDDDPSMELHGKMLLGRPPKIILA
jgi:3-hydroxy-9,10-secoandrosta-1,3,5(10)-triene-9,17-dione monooxygenase